MLEGLSPAQQSADGESTSAPDPTPKTPAALEDVISTDTAGVTMPVLRRAERRRLPRLRLPRVPAVEPRRLIVPIALGLVLWSLVGALAGFGALSATSWVWVAAALAATQLTLLTDAVALSGAVPIRLPLRERLQLQAATVFAGFLGGTVASLATIVRSLTRRGLTPTAAFGSGVLAVAAAVAVQLVLVLMFLPVALSQFDRAPAGSPAAGSGALQLLLYAVTAAGLVGAIEFAAPRVRRALRLRKQAPFSSAWDAVNAVTAQPGRTYRLFTGAALTQVLLTAGLVLCVHAVGGHVNFGGVVFVVAFTSVIGTLAPVPGGMGVMEASLIVGLTLFGVPQDVAIAATLLFRSCTTYLPALWGWRVFDGVRTHITG
jgi:uncharacterized membrane protein YbhN (UPF0104 family)